MKQILFVVHLDKFTNGFYRFISSNFRNQINWFLLYGNQREYDFITDDEHVFRFNSFREISKSNPVVQIARNCNLVLYSGIFGSEKCLLKFGCSTLKKTYVHLWGGDFYIFRHLKKCGKKEKINLLFRKYVIEHSAGVINLIPNEYGELCKLCRPKGLNFVAPMCDNGDVMDVISSASRIPKFDAPIRILLGNSATESNQHMPILRLLEKYKEEDIQIICPLSYGEEEYRESIIEYGIKIFGEKFKPVLDYMKIEQYYSLIATCTVAIFNNDRQQAMGNIMAALGLNCKVYIKSDTPMWKFFRNDNKMEIYDVSDVNKMNFNEFISIDKCMKNNYDRCKKHYDKTSDIRQWEVIFDSVKEING